MQAITCFCFCPHWVRVGEQKKMCVHNKFDLICCAISCACVCLDFHMWKHGRQSQWQKKLFNTSPGLRSDPSECRRSPPVSPPPAHRGAVKPHTLYTCNAIAVNRKPHELRWKCVDKALRLGTRASAADRFFLCHASPPFSMKYNFWESTRYHSPLIDYVRLTLYSCSIKYFAHYDYSIIILGWKRRPFNEMCTQSEWCLATVSSSPNTIFECSSRGRKSN